MTRVRIEELGDAVEAAYEIARTCQAYDQPDVPFSTLDDFRAFLTTGWPGYGHERYLGFLDGAPVGRMNLAIAQDDNLDTVMIEMSVLPEARRHGVGRALFDLAAERTRALGRRHLIGGSVQRHPDGGAFATAMGAKPGLEELRSRLDVRTADDALLGRLHADALAHSGGYRLVRWTGVPPDEIIDDVAYLDGRLNADAPVGDLSIEPEKVDAERVRQSELARIARGRMSYNTGALRGDRLVAWTAIAVEPAAPRQAWQNITLVDPDHRGHRLGLLVKIENLRYVRAEQPGLEVIDTFNAAANEHMLRINRAMGFREVETVVQWQRTLA
ncbi:GNAT family N-acetyltransferase [Paractinoplanes deccanensis]|uniref:GNAT family N-acetyltransferase n=1 Tax=Paractinoplanes deccanensis TaxID=113561 RepID=A0ABQ3YD87_9ACTN|nr:GNAT family N-acetyltransferase [Actinoplanes deccanensis]GID77979.1 GNAT family N-acetyltransferase [Actinoplanes deccanensis]